MPELGRGQFVLRKVVGGIGHYAEVQLHISQLEDGSSVVFSGNEFLWLRTTYRPDAIVDGPSFDEDRAHVRRGVDYALKNLPDEYDIEELQIVIDIIKFTIVDTTPDDLALTACFATWNALGVEGLNPPYYEDGRTIIFPGKQDQKR